MGYAILFGLIAGHLASVLTMVAYLLKDILWLRLLTILSCFAGIAFNYLVPSTPLWSVINWNLLFAAINVVQVAIIVRERSGIQFTEEEKDLHETLFRQFAPFEFMKLLRIGKWLQAKPGDVLTVEGQAVECVMLIYDGRLSVESKGEEVAQLQDGNFIGEMSFITGGVATATVRAVEPTRYLSWPKIEIDKLLRRSPSMESKMRGSFSVDLSEKLAGRAPAFQGKIHLPSS